MGGGPFSISSLKEWKTWQDVVLHETTTLLKTSFALGSFHRPSMQMPIMWPFSQFYLGSVKLRMVKLTGLQASQEQSVGQFSFGEWQTYCFHRLQPMGPCYTLPKRAHGCVPITTIFISSWLFFTYVLVFFSVAPYPREGWTPRDIDIKIIASCHTSIKIDGYWPMGVKDPGPGNEGPSRVSDL
jgi:hypothetical protein